MNEGELAHKAGLDTTNRRPMKDEPTESPPPPARFDHVGISVPNLEAATEWYCDVLHLSAERSFAVPGTDLRGVMLIHDSGYRIELLHRPDAAPGLVPDSALSAAATLGFGHICLCVEDVDAEFHRFVDAGASVRMAPSPAPRPGGRMSFVADPYGNLLELIDRKTLCC